MYEEKSDIQKSQGFRSCHFTAEHPKPDEQSFCCEMSLAQFQFSNCCMLVKLWFSTPSLALFAATTTNLRDIHQRSYNFFNRVGFHQNFKCFFYLHPSYFSTPKHFSAESEDWFAQYPDPDLARVLKITLIIKTVFILTVLRFKFQ